MLKACDNQLIGYNVMDQNVASSAVSGYHIRGSKQQQNTNAATSSSGQGSRLNDILVAGTSTGSQEVSGMRMDKSLSLPIGSMISPTASCGSVSPRVPSSSISLSQSLDELNTIKSAVASASYSVGGGYSGGRVVNISTPVSGSVPGPGISLCSPSVGVHHSDLQGTPFAVPKIPMKPRT